MACGMLRKGQQREHAHRRNIPSLPSRSHYQIVTSLPLAMTVTRSNNRTPWRPSAAWAIQHRAPITRW